MAVSREPEFRTTRMREGYDLDAVDDFIDLVIDALEGRNGRGITPEQIEAEEFKVVRMREGYVMDDVDDWLDAAAVELRRMKKNSQVPATTYSTSVAPPTMQSAHVSAQPTMPVPPPTPPPVVHPPVVHPPVAPPAVAPGYAQAPAPANTQNYPAYNDTQQSTAHGLGYTTAHGYDALTDSAVNELDPVLRALDHTYVDEAPAASRLPVQTPAGQTHGQPPQPAADDQSLAPSSTPSTGLHHLEVWVRDIDAATRSFGWLFERLGWTLFQAWDNGRSWQAPGGGPYVVVESSPDLSWVAYDRKAPGLNHLALAVPEQWMVDRIVSEAPAYGWRLMFADRHPHAGGPHHYAAYMENDEGFEVEVVAP